ncbi:hypothetical protein [Conexibacter sp. DBS9H8]|uniref:hypothetical protein n=1 Tax=Conexibacter sp. DBS9H8 TaxID=2937801 RepID=UPI00200CB41B|nr:hypothetical protein [Conexibacter sp. DBS9H8]
MHADQAGHVHTFADDAASGRGTGHGLRLRGRTGPRVTVVIATALTALVMCPVGTGATVRAQVDQIRLTAVAARGSHKPPPPRSRSCPPVRFQRNLNAFSDLRARKLSCAQTRSILAKLSLRYGSGSGRGHAVITTGSLTVRCVFVRRAVTFDGQVVLGGPGRCSGPGARLLTFHGVQYSQ